MDSGRWATFDCYGTLIDWEAGLSAALREWADGARLPAPTEELLSLVSEIETVVQGERSPALLYPDVLAEVLRRIGERLGVRAREVAPSAVRIAGPELGAIALAAAASLSSGLPFLIVRKEAKAYGTGRRLEGIFTAGEEVCLVEDVVTSGGAAADAIDVLRDAGLECRVAICVVDREEGGVDALDEAIQVIGRESDQPFHGSVRQWTDQLTSTVTEQGMNGFVFWPADDHENQLARFAGEVVPAVRTVLDRQPAIPPPLDPQGRATP